MENNKVFFYPTFIQRKTTTKQHSTVGVDIKTGKKEFVLFIAVLGDRFSSKIVKNRTVNI